MDSMMEGNGVILEEATVTGHADSMASGEFPQLMLFYRELRENQKKLLAELTDVSFNVRELLQYTMVGGGGPSRSTVPKKSWQSKKSVKSFHSSESDAEEMGATKTEPCTAKIAHEIPHVPRGRVSLLVDQDNNPATSKSLNSFRQINACVDGNILRRGLTRAKVFESGSQSFTSSRSASKNLSFRPFGRPRVQPQPEPSDNPPRLDFADLKSKAALAADSEFSMSALFKHRETQLMPKTATTMSPARSTEDGEPVKSVPLLARYWLMMVSVLLRLCGALPWASFSPFDEMDEDGPGPWQRRFSKWYRWFLVLLNVVGLGLCLFLGAWQHSQDSSVLGTASGLSLGAAVMFCWSSPMRNSETEHEQTALMSYLENFMLIGGLGDRWTSRKSRDALKAVLLWCCTVGVQAYLIFDDERPPWHNAVRIGSYAIAAGCLLSACYVQATTWNGINMMIFAFAQCVLRGEWDCHESRRNWREAVSLMRVTSRVYQRSFATFFLTTLLVFFATLFDIHQGQALQTLPSLVLAVGLMICPFVAASATAHCTRLPSLVSMMDGDEDQEAQFLDLANFLTLCESGFFMWDTRVSIGVLQKFVYFSVAIVSTIGFQLGVFHF